MKKFLLAPFVPNPSRGLLVYLSVWVAIGWLCNSCEFSRKKSYRNHELVPDEYQFPYDFNHPTKKYFLGEDLEEISGLSWFGGNQLACVQDESGRVFIYDPEKDKITDRIKFGKSGDYEGVEWVEDTLYVVKSDGTLLSFSGTNAEPEVTTTELPLGGEIDIEGLAYDPVSHYLLLGVKSMRDSLDQLVKDKIIYAFDPATRQMLPEPFMIIQQEALEKFVMQNKSGSSKKKKEEKVIFKPSGIAVHPITKEVYVIASDGKKLLVLNRKGKLLAGVEISPRMLKQPEGICFSPTGDLFISSEGRGEDGFILKFEYQKSQQ